MTERSYVPVLADESVFSAEDALKIVEMRAPNPFTNTYMVTAAFYLSALDGIVAVLRSGKDLSLIHI